MKLYILLFCFVNFLTGTISLQALTFKTEYFTVASIVANVFAKFHDKLPSPTPENPKPRWQRLKKMVWFIETVARMISLESTKPSVQQKPT